MALPATDPASLLAVVAARIDESGGLVEANRGFLRIIEADAAAPPAINVARFFIQPDFATLAAAAANADGDVHEGLFTIGDIVGTTRSLRGRMWREGRQLVLFAEHDIERLEHLQETVIDLNREYADTQLQLVHSNQKVQQLNVRLEQRVAERTQALHDALRHAEAASRAKSRFLANMTHELRTPMNAIIGMTDLALRRAADPKQIEHLGQSKAAAQRLLAIINDVLEMSRLVVDSSGLDLADFSLRALFDAAMAPLEARARAKGLALESRIDPALPSGLYGDAGRIGRVIGHFLSNAIKFSERGLITLAARLVKAQGDELTLRIEVSDAGIGVAEDAQQRIFDLFEQSDNSPTRQHGGTGLGLALCKQSVLAMGGEIGVRSQPGEGSTFWAKLPLKRGAEPSAAAVPPASDGGTLAGSAPETVVAAPAVDWDAALQAAGELVDLVTVGDFRVRICYERNAALIDALLGADAGEFNAAVATFDWEIALRLLRAAMGARAR